MNKMKKVERQQLRARVKRKATDDITSRLQISLWDRWMCILSQSLYREGQNYPDPEITTMCTLAV